MAASADGPGTSLLLEAAMLIGYYETLIANRALNRLVTKHQSRCGEQIKKVAKESSSALLEFIRADRCDQTARAKSLFAAIQKTESLGSGLPAYGPKKGAFFYNDCVRPSEGDVIV